MAEKVTKTHKKPNGKDLSPCIMVEKVWSEKNGTHIGACLSLYAKWMDWHLFQGIGADCHGSTCGRVCIFNSLRRM